MFRAGLVFIAVFFYLLSPTFNFLDVSSSIIIFAIVIIIFFLEKNIYSFSKNIVYCVIFLLFLGGYSALAQVTILDITIKPDNFVFLKIMINNIMYLVFGVMFVSILEKYSGINSLLKVIGFCIFINCCIILLTSLIPGVKDITESLLSQQHESNLDYVNGFRARGFAAAGGFSLSVICIMAALFLMHLNLNKYISSAVTLIIVAVIALSQIFIARTGLYAICLLICFWFFYAFLVNKDRASLVFFSVITIFMLLSFISIYGSQLDFILSWALELVNNFLDGDGLHTTSSDDLVSMYNIPSDTLKIIFGFGFYEADVSYRSDSGYIKSLYSLGLLSIFLYAFHYIMLCKMLPHKYPELKRMFIILFVLLMILEVKGPVFYQNYPSRLLFLLYGYLFCKKTK